MILLIDNFDSFSYNLYQLAGSIEPNIVTVRNNEIDADGVRKLAPDHIIISPGPGRPCDAGNCIDIIRQTAGGFPVLGVCLGHQAITEAFGNTHPLFKGLNEHIFAARYHSLVAQKETLPDCFEILGMSADNEIMAIAHKTMPIYGVQFHPESIMTPDGRVILKNFLDM